VHTLKADYDLHCFFSNPNIQPSDEYEKRLAEARRTALHFEVPFTAAGYDPLSWESAIAPWSHTPEGGERCEHCFALRLRETARFCRSLGWPRFTTVMSVSPHKRIGMLNRVGAAMAAEAGVEYVPFDFKKKNGFLGSIALSKELGIYRQDYCGCRLSLLERDERLKKKLGVPAP
jgi:predicted adenine nucleotide alpha hydrolase (AANH) superfamily ATPase